MVVLGDELEQSGGEVELVDAQQQQYLDRVQVGERIEQQHLQVAHVRHLNSTTPSHH